MPGGVRKPQLNLETVAVLMSARGVDSFSQMARLTGIDRTYLSKVLRGLRPAQPSHVLAIAQALKAPPVAILRDVEVVEPAA